MSSAPAHPKIYHIVHVDRLAAVITHEHLYCDSTMTQRTGAGPIIGMTAIKQRRLQLPVDCQAGTFVGDYVPFYFCPRSIMLYVIHHNNHPELTYHGGQGPIVHLEADLDEVIQHADHVKQRWAFSLSNAGARYTSFLTGANQLNQLNWPAIAARDFRDPAIKESKQAEFLIHQSFPWALVRRIGVQSQAIYQRVVEILQKAGHKPQLQIRPEWYY